MSAVTCQYCGHSADETERVCPQCGAPLPAAPPPEPPTETSTDFASENNDQDEADEEPDEEDDLMSKKSKQESSGHRPGILARFVHDLTKGLPFIGEKKGDSTIRPRFSWLLLLIIVFLIGVLVVWLFPTSCSFDPSKLADFAGPGSGNTHVVEALPQALQHAASCQPENSDLQNVRKKPSNPAGPVTMPVPGSSSKPRVQSCVVEANDPLLADDITGGRDLRFTTQLGSEDQLNQTIRSWRSSRGTILSTGDVFVMLNSSDAILYADTKKGLRVDTGRFANRAGAQTFLKRSGLLPG